jgi:DNA polymerase-3 subunit delta
MSHPILERHIERGTVRPLYLFYGEEEFLMNRALARLEQAITNLAGEPPTKVLREAPEANLAEFLTEARAATLWGPGQLLVLRGVDSVPDDQLKNIGDYLDRPAPRAWVVLLAEGKPRELAKHAIWTRLQQAEAALVFSRFREGELYQWLTREAETLGKSLSPAAAQRLLEMVGDNLAELSQELEKLALFAGAEKILTPALVAQLASHSRSYNIFALTDTLGEPGAAKRLAALENLLDLGEHPAKILVMLARQIRSLIYLKESRGGTSQEAARRVNLPPGIMKKLAQQATRFSERGLRAHLFLLHQADLQLKTGTGNPRLWLEWALLKMGPDKESSPPRHQEQQGSKKPVS